MAGTYDSNREAVFLIHLHKEFLAFYLIPGVLPVRICQSRSFSYDISRCGFMISRSRAYIDILPCSACKQSVIAFNLRYMKAYKFAYTIKAGISQFIKDCLLIINICGYLFNPFRQHM